MRRISRRSLHLLGEVALGAAGLGMAGTLLLAFRLGHGPLDVTWAARQVLRHLPPQGVEIAIGHAALAFEGFSAHESPLDFRVENLSLRQPGSGASFILPRGRLTFSLAQLLRLRLVPRTLELDGAALSLSRDPAGGLRLDVAAGGAGNTAATDAAAAPEGDWRSLLAALASAPKAGDALPWLSDLRRVRLADCVIDIRDPHLPAAIRAPGAAIEIDRHPTGGVSGTARLTLTAGTDVVPVQARAEMDGTGTRIHLKAGPLTPASWADLAAVPALKAAALPLSLDADITLDHALTPLSAHAKLTAGAGRIALGQGHLAIARAQALLRAVPGHITAAAIDIEPQQAGKLPPPLLHLSGDAVIDPAQALSLTAGVQLDQADLGELALYWPEGTGGGARPWIIENITAGRVHEARADLALSTGAHFSQPTLTKLGGGFTAEGVRGFWLKPVPGLEEGTLAVTLESPDQLRIAIKSALTPSLGAGRLVVENGEVVIAGLSKPDQTAAIRAHVHGPAGALAELLAHPRLHLLADHPLGFGVGAGAVAADVAVHLPLSADVSMAQVGIEAKAQLSALTLTQLADGHDLTDGEAVLQVTQAGLSGSGTGSMAEARGRFELKMDFRDGPPGQILQSVQASADIPPAGAVLWGLPEDIMRAGHAQAAVQYTASRGNPSRLSIAADLTPAELTTPLGWGKAAGVPARGDLQMTLRDGQVIAVDRMSVTAPRLALDARADFLAAPHVYQVTRAEIDGTSATGTVRAPAQPDLPWQVRLSGPLLDLVPYFRESAKQVGSDADDLKRGPRYVADLEFDGVALADGKTMRNLRIAAENDGLRFLSARVTAAGGTGGANPGGGGMQLAIERSGGVRRLNLVAADAGVALAALDITGSIRGGSLSLRGTYDDRVMPPRLTGTAELRDFGVLDAPAIGQLLQAATLYGVADLLRGKGLSFARLEAPFAYQGRKLDLANARAFSASLGLTAEGRIDLRRKQLDLRGTVVPAYVFNTLLGEIPVLGKLFSPEKGGGLFAAQYTLKGKLGNPQVAVNPLSALTPGFLRGVFGIIEAPPRPR